jgi:hypothetical protein
VIAILLVLLANLQMGTNIFNPDKVVQCQTRAVDPNNSNGNAEVSMPQLQSGKTTIDCNTARNFLKDAQKLQGNENELKVKNSQNPQDAADPQKFAQDQADLKAAQNTDLQNRNAKDLIKKRGGIDQALQDFLTPGFGANAQKILFAMAFASVFFGYSNGFREIVKEDPIYRRERAVNLGIMPYMFSKVVVLGAFCLFQSAVLTAVVEIGEPLQNAQGVFLTPILEVYITLALSTLAGLMTGLAVSAFASNNDLATSFLPIAMVPQMFLAGVLIPLKDPPFQIFAMLFPTRWAMVGLGSTVGLHSNPISKDHLFGNDEAYHGTLFSIYSQADAMQRLLLAWAGLGAIIIVFMIVVAILLKRKDVKA